MQTFLSLSSQPAENSKQVAATFSEAKSLSNLFTTGKVLAQQTTPTRLDLQNVNSLTTLKIEPNEVKLPIIKGQTFHVFTVASPPNKAIPPQQTVRSANAVTSTQRSEALVANNMQNTAQAQHSQTYATQKILVALGELHTNKTMPASPMFNLSNVLKQLKASIPSTPLNTFSVTAQVVKSGPKSLVVGFPQLPQGPISIPIDNPTRRPSSGASVSLQISLTPKQVEINWVQSTASESKTHETKVTESAALAPKASAQKAHGLQEFLPNQGSAKTLTSAQQPTTPLLAKLPLSAPTIQPLLQLALKQTGLRLHMPISDTSIGGVNSSALNKIPLTQLKLAGTALKIIQPVAVPIIQFDDPENKVQAQPIKALLSHPSIGLTEAKTPVSPPIHNLLPKGQILSQETVSLLAETLKQSQVNSTEDARKLIAQLPSEQKSLLRESLLPLMRHVVAKQQPNLDIKTVTDLVNQLQKDPILSGDKQNATQLTKLTTLIANQLKVSIAPSQPLQQPVQNTLPAQHQETSLGESKATVPKTANSGGKSETVEIKESVATGSKDKKEAADSNVQSPHRKASANEALQQSVRNLLTELALPVNSQISPVSAVGNQGNSFLTGIITLLNIVLTNKAQRLASHTQQAPNNAPKSVLQSSEVGSIENKPKTLRHRQVATSNRTDQSSLNLQSRLLRQLVGLLANHQKSKLSQVDASLNGQDQLHYVLPAMFAGKQPVELLIKREQRQEDRNADNQLSVSTWNLTMRLDVGDLGQMLAKTKLSSETLNIDFYTESPQLLHKINTTLKSLHKRLASLGLEIAQINAQIGHIPDSLADKSINLLEARA